MKDSNPKTGIVQRITGLFSRLLGTEPPAEPPARARRLQRPSGAGPAVKIPRPPGPEEETPRTPVAVESDSHLTETRFDSFDLPDEVRRGITDAGFERTTPIQAKTLPLALAGTDVAAQAQTGTGKTAAFLVATFTRLVRGGRRAVPGSPRAFIIAPTRELVAQIEEDAKLLGAHTGLRIHAVYGGVDYDRQRDVLRQGIDVLIGTPGRLIDYYKQKVYNLRGVEVLVIDEADRMFDMGFLPDLRYLLRKLPPFHERQSMLFSATLPYRVMELAYEHMNLPTKIEVAPEQKTAEGIEQLVYHVGSHEKVRLLLGLLKRDQGERILIFVNTKVEAERLVRRLGANGHSAAEISGDVPQRRRLSTLANFKDGSVPILVATDVAARGLHIDGVTHVYNYDVPLNPEDYVHRIGRTARAGAKGHAITFACERYVAGLAPIEAYIDQKLPVQWADDSLFVEEKKAPPRRDPEPTTEGEQHGAPRGGHGRGDRGHRGRRGSGRPDRAENVAGHHVAKPASIEAQLEAEGVEFESIEGTTPMGDGAPRKRRRRRRRGPRGEEAEASATAEQTDERREPEGDADQGEAADRGEAAAATADGEPRRRRRRRRRGKGGRGPATEGGETQEAEPVEVGSFWDPSGL